MLSAVFPTVGKREKKRAGGILDMADEADYGAYPMKDHRLEFSIFMNANFRDNVDCFYRLPCWGKISYSEKNLC